MTHPGFMHGETNGSARLPATPHFPLMEQPLSLFSVAAQFVPGNCGDTIPFNGIELPVIGIVSPNYLELSERIPAENLIVDGSVRPWRTAGGIGQPGLEGVEPDDE